MNTIQIIPQTRYVGQFIPLIQWETPVLLLVLAMSESTKVHNNQMTKVQKDQRIMHQVQAFAVSLGVFRCNSFLFPQS